MNGMLQGLLALIGLATLIALANEMPVLITGILGVAIMFSFFIAPLIDLYNRHTSKTEPYYKSYYQPTSYE
jgi:pilus assembly protein TadC